MARHAPSNGCSIADIGYIYLLIEVTSFLTPGVPPGTLLRSARAATKSCQPAILDVAGASARHRQQVAVITTRCHSPEGRAVSGALLCETPHAEATQEVLSCHAVRSRLYQTASAALRWRHVCASKILWNSAAAGPVGVKALEHLDNSHLCSRLACAWLHVAARYGPGGFECCYTCRRRMCIHASGGRILRAPSYQAYCLLT